MLAIFDDYGDATKELMQSLATAGITCTPLVIHYDGELPAGARCPFVEYTGLPLDGDPLFFNEVPVPPWCEIRQGREPFGEILRDGFLLGRIQYAPGSFRQVASVDWLHPDRSFSHTDRYDVYGNRYATTYYSAGTPYQTVYRGPGPWQIEVGHATRAVTLRSATTVLTFASLTDFVLHYIDDLGLADDRVLINSLSYPLFVTRRRATAPTTTLLWQEPMPGDVPENMDTELTDPKAIARIVFDDEGQYRKVANRYPGTAVDLAYLSPLGQFAEHEGFDPKRAFTLTNSDELPGLVELLEAFPDVTFSVAALTLMSQKLHDLARRHPNLVLTPTVSHSAIRRELAQASVYLDINAGAHVLDVVNAAYYLDLVVFALAPRAKAPAFSRTFATLDELKARLDAVTRSTEQRARALTELHMQRGPQSTIDDWRRIFG